MTDTGKTAAKPTAHQIATSALALAEENRDRLAALSAAGAAGDSTDLTGALAHISDRLNQLEKRPDPASMAELSERTTKRIDDLTKASEAAITDLAAAASKGMGELTDAVLTLAERVTAIEQRDHTTPQGNTSAPPRDQQRGTGQHVLGLVLAVMRRVAEIGKTRDGKATDSATYKFRGIDDAMNAVGIAMREVGVVMRTEVVSQEYDTRAVEKVWNGKPSGTTLWTTCIARMRYVFVSPFDGSEHALEGIGQGRDAGDKAASKALSGAMKYALFQGLCIPVTGVNVDAEESPGDMSDDQRPHDDPSWRDQPAYGNRAEYEKAKAARQPASTDERAVKRTAEPQPEQPAAENSKPKMTLEQAAAYTVQKLQSISDLDAAQRLPYLDKLEAYARAQEGMMGTPVDDIAVAAHIAAVRRTLVPAPTPPNPGDQTWAANMGEPW